MSLYSRVLLYFSLFVLLLAILYGVYLYLFAPIPGDTTSITSKTFRKNNPVITDTESVIARNVLMTNTGALSFLFVTDQIRDYNDADPVMYPILTLYRSDNPLNRGPIAIRTMYNRLTSEIVLGFYNSSGDVFTVPISTSLYKEKLSVAIRLMNTGNTTSFLANVYLNGEYITSRGIPNSFVPTGGNSHTITAGSNDGVNGRIQTIRVWDNAKNLTDDDFMKISKDPFNI